LSIFKLNLVKITNGNSVFGSTKIFTIGPAASKTYTTMCFRDLAKLNLPMVVRLKLEPIFDTAPAASKNKARFKSGQS
jgi:hypothetical protein